jgi:NADPH:quinone reductase-like Zn-dependent oxidoreductase
MKAIVFDSIGPPTEVLQLREVPLPKIRDHEALIRMVCAPVNPGDFLFIENLYPEPKKPKLPGQIAGNHGAGIVQEVGKDVHLEPGAYVAFSYYHTWAEYAAIPAEWLIPLPSKLQPEKAGQFFNLITAWDLLSATRAEEGDWLAVTAGNSTVSTMLLQFATARGINVVPIVRQPRADLKALGAVEVIVIEGAAATIRDQVMHVTKGKGIKALVDNVGGPVTGELIRSMAFGGQVIINGGMSPDRFELHNFDVLMSGIELRSHVYRYFFTPPQAADMKELAEIAAAAASSDFKIPIGGRNNLDQFRTAVRESLENPGRGKQFFRFDRLE